MPCSECLAEDWWGHATSCSQWAAKTVDVVVHLTEDEAHLVTEVALFFDKNPETYIKDLVMETAKLPQVRMRRRWAQ